MPRRRQFWLAFCSLVLTFGNLFMLLDFGSGLTIGARRYRSDYEFVCGLSFRDGNIWYFPYVIPIQIGSINSPDTLRHSDHQRDGLLGFRFIPYFPTRQDWYCAAVVPFWFLGGISV